MATNRLRKRIDDADEKTLSRMTENFCLVSVGVARREAELREMLTLIIGVITDWHTITEPG